MRAANAQVRAHFEPVLQLKVPESAAFGFTASSRIVERSDGGYVVAPITDAGRIAWFDSRGRLQQVTGRPGEGPGELRLIHSVAALSDGSVAIAGSRLSVLKPGQNVAQPQVSREGQEVLSMNSREILVNKLLMPGAKGSPFVVWSTGLDSIRAIQDPFTSMLGDPTFRRMARRNESSVVVSPVTAFEFAIIDIRTGRATPLRIGNVRFPSAKFMSVDRRQPHVAKPYSRVLSLHVYGVDTLVVIYAEATKDWSPAPMRPQGREGGVVPAKDISKYLSFKVDIIDMRNGRSIGQHTLQQAVSAFVGPGIAFSIEESSDGDLYFQLYRLRLVPAVPFPKK
ncbi:MAG: hypothetical protein M3Q98_05610 [Actinomycetota bacterium]|nr:hypothetical protein [Actinomycetota bacterium]